MYQQQSLFGPPPRPYLPPLVGYCLTADNPDKDREFGTYMMARTLEDAFQWCAEYFPLEEGYIHLEVWDYEESKTVRRLMPDEYIERNGKLTPIINNLSQERKDELILHIPTCEVCLQDCEKCWEFYSNMGHDEYVRVLTSDMQ